MTSPEFDAERLTVALGRSLGTEAVVTSSVATSIGTGQVGENVRFELTWDVDDADLPTSIVGKFPSTSEISRATAVQLETYVKEIGFYRDLQSLVTIRTPVVHAVEWNATTHDFVLLMEDIRPSAVGDQLAGAGVDAAQLAVDEAVGLHAPTWGRVPNLDWLHRVGREERTELYAQMLEMLTPGFVERYEGRLDRDDLDLAGRLSSTYRAWGAAVSNWIDRHDASCLVHGDYRLDNMLFGEPPDSPPLTVVDWQTVSVGFGPADVAYYCGAGMLPEVRAEHDRSLVERYAAGLRAAGVEIADDDVWDGYVLGSATGYFMAVLASQVVERTERGDEMFAVMAERHARQIRSVGLLGLLDAG